MAEGALRELLVSWGVEVDEEPLEKLESHLESIKKGFEHVGERLMEYFAFREMKEFVMGTIEMGAHLSDMSEQLGVSTDALQKFQFAAKLGGVDAESAAHSLGLFSRQLGEAKTGGGEAAKTLAQLHVQYKDANGKIRPVLDILGDVADKLKDTDPAERSAYAMRLFGRAGMGMIPVLKEGREGLTKLYDEFDKLGGGLSDDFIKDAKEADDEIQKMKLGFISLRGHLVQMMLPTIKQVVDVFMDFTKGLVDLAKQTHAFQHLWDFAKILAVVKAVKMLIPLFRAIAAGEGLIDALNPFAWLVIGALALYAILDDLWTMMEGGKSVIGDALGPEKAGFVMDLKEDFAILSGAAHELFGLFEGDGEKSMSGFTEAVVMLGKALKYAADLMAAIVEGGKKIGEGIGGLIFGEGKVAGVDKSVSMTPEAQAAYDALERTKGGANRTVADPHVDRMAQIAAEIRAQHDARASLPPGQAAALSGTNPTGYQGPTGPMLQVNKLEVNVKHTGNEDPKKLAGQIATGTRDELDSALVNANNALKRK